MHAKLWKWERCSYSGAGLLSCPSADLELLHPPFALDFVTSQHFSSLNCSLRLVGEEGTWLVVAASAFSPHSAGMRPSPLICFWGNCGTPAPRALRCGAVLPHRREQLLLSLTHPYKNLGRGQFAGRCRCWPLSPRAWHVAGTPAFRRSRAASRGAGAHRGKKAFHFKPLPCQSWLRKV